MTENPVFQPLSPDGIKAITDSIEIGYQLISVTLVTGDELIGGLAKHWGWNGEDVSISFNNHSGKIFGLSHSIKIPINQIANINTIPLTNESIPLWPNDDTYVAKLREIGMEHTFNKRLCVQDYPNPWATWMEQHNTQICKQLGLKIEMGLESALSRDSIPSEGIMLERDFILYADWDYFSHQMHGATSLSASAGVVGVTKDFSPSLQSFIFNHLSQNFQKIKNIQEVVVQTGVDEIFARGCILSPQPPQDTEIEGEKCILLACGNAQDTGDAVYPVLVKQKAFKYPLEFVSQIRSQLVFYGEFLPVPLEVFGRKQHYTILARAIGYLQQ